MAKEKLKLNSRVRLEAGSGDDDGVLFDTHSASICACNGTAWVILSELRDGATLDELGRSVAAHFEVDEVAARQDAAELVARLSKMDLLDVVR